MEELLSLMILPDHIIFKGVTFFHLFVFVCCFCRLWQKPDSWNALHGVRSKKPFSSSSFSSLLVVSHCIWTALVSFSVEATETVLWHFVEERRKSESVTVAYGGRAGLKRITSLFSSVVDRSSVRPEMGVLGCGVLVFALISQCHSRSVQTLCSGSRGETVSSFMIFNASF